MYNIYQEKRCLFLTTENNEKKKLYILYIIYYQEC